MDYHDAFANGVDVDWRSTGTGDSAHRAYGMTRQHDHELTRLSTSRMGATGMGTGTGSSHGGRSSPEDILRYPSCVADSVAVSMMAIGAEGQKEASFGGFEQARRVLLGDPIY
jgi:hypothetical protein